MAFSGAEITRLGLYGGSRYPYGSFAGKAIGQVIKAVTSKAAPRRRIRQRQIMIGNELFVIKSPEHERYLLQRYLEQQRIQFAQAIHQKKMPSVKLKLKVITTNITRVQNRLNKVDRKVWLAREEEELLLLMTAS